MEMKLTIEQLKNYLGTGLKCKSSIGFTKVIGIKEASQLTGGFDLVCIDNHKAETLIEYIKPICYRLSDLDKFIPELGFVPAEKLLSHYKKCEYRLSGNLLEKINPKAKNSWGYMYVNIGNLKYEDTQKLFQWHFWPFGDEYFESGLVIDKLKQ